MNNDGLTIVIPAYNEENNIREVISSWYDIIKDKEPNSRLVVNISGSNDNTEKIIKNMMLSMPRLFYIKDSGNTYGIKVIDLYRNAIENENNYIFQTDSDGQTNPKEFAEFWNLRNKYDSIIGARINRGDGKTRAFVERVVCLLILVFFNIRVPDANAPFRLMNRDFLKQCLDTVPAEYSMPNIMITIFGAIKANVAFKDISFSPRTKGKNSMNYKKIAATGIESLKAFWCFRKKMIKSGER